MLTGTIAINDFTLWEWTATNQGVSYINDARKYYEVTVEGYDKNHKRHEFVFDVHVLPLGPIKTTIDILYEIERQILLTRPAQ